jgi:tyrosine phenol-lyase
MKSKVIIEPFRIKSVEPIPFFNDYDREKFLSNAFNNPFLLKSEHVLIDLLTDSGTAAMSTNQWAAMMKGDESYAGARSWENFERAVRELTGMPYILPTHQGRAAERILYKILSNGKKYFISNTHFDTTRANIEYYGCKAIDIPSGELKDINSSFHFKGNIETAELKKLIVELGAENIAAVILTVTNNSGGGQPVSMANTKEVSKICRKHRIFLVLDCSRIAENSYFVQSFEKEYSGVSCKHIAQEMFTLSDITVMSAKKDALVNMGGFMTMNDETLSEECTQQLIITEGFTTYGGLTGRDLEAIAVGLEEAFDEHYLQYRIRSTQYLGDNLYKKGIPLLYPIGGHAVYIDAKQLYQHIPVDQYPGQALVCELYLQGGIRSVEIGSVMFGKYDENKKLIPATRELVRLAIPRRVYTQSHIDYVIEVFDEILAKKKEAVGLKIIKESKFLRHFTARFERIK